MPPKRKNGVEEEGTSREKKKQKIAAARMIAVQEPKAVSFSDNVVAGPSTQRSLNTLPSAIDVERFTEARAFEISAMQDAMKNASVSSTSRAWQALPRHLRRRSASHDIRRVPLRLRDKARAEMDPVHKKASGRSLSKLGRTKRPTRTETLMKRQRDKSWLETHLWHAKRMKMENIWGYKLAVHPTEKAFRPSHRASVHGSILHDASYHAIIELKGPQNILKAILEACCDPQGVGPGAVRYTTGSRSLDTHFYRPGSYPFGLVSPISVIWRPQVCSSPPHSDEPANGIPESRLHIPKRKRKGNEKGKAKETTEPIVTPEGRVVWLRVHPSAFDDVFSSLSLAASSSLDAAKRKNGGDGEEIEVDIADLRGEINTFEITGPKSNQVLKGALSPVPQDQRIDFQKFWSGLGNWQTSGELTRGIIIGFTIQDPRLKFPPKNARPSLCHALPGMALQPSPELASSELWNEQVRNGLSKPRFKKKDLDERRSKLLIPGTPLQPLRQDDRIPVLLIQRSVENSGSANQGLHGWTLIIPAGWSMAFMNSLTFTGTRVGGQRERQTQAFEAGTAYFPHDLPSSTGYETYAATRGSEQQAQWTKKPPAKRPNFEKLGTRSPWRADWEVVLGLSSPTRSIVPEADLVTTQREETNNAAVEEKTLTVWLLRGVEVPSIIANMSKLFNPGAALQEQINRLRVKRGHEPFGASMKAGELMKAALVSVRIKVWKRGTPADLAMIYGAEDDEVRNWNKVMQMPGYAGDLDDEENTVHSTDEGCYNHTIKRLSIVPSDAPAVGYVTSGHFCLSQGQGSAIGAVSLIKALELFEQTRRLSPNSASRKMSGFVKVRNGNSQECRPAFIELLDN